MTISFYSNFINHHQVFVSRELYKITHGNFRFIEMQPMPDSFKHTGYPEFSSEPFVIRAWMNSSECAKAEKLVLTSDVVIYTPYAFDIVKPRLITEKISFDVGERWFKKGIKNILSPTLLKMQWFYHTKMNKQNNYKLCSSAYGSSDQYKLRSFIGKCYKWGYFTKVDLLDVKSLPTPRNGRCISMMWCSRMIDWKHPEIAVSLAKKLQSKGYDFIIHMFGDGPLRKKMEGLVISKGLQNYVKFCGNVSNDLILSEMRKHDLFLFTSDKNEGWGAVANEAMANGCVLVGSKEIGSVPYLIKDGVNGFVFESCNLVQLYTIVEQIIKSPEILQNMSLKSYETIHNLWSPEQAAQNLIQLISALRNGSDTPIQEGPCSKALPII